MSNSEQNDRLIATGSFLHDTPNALAQGQGTTTDQIVDPSWDKIRWLAGILILKERVKAINSMILDPVQGKVNS